MRFDELQARLTTLEERTGQRLRRIEMLLWLILTAAVVLFAATFGVEIAVVVLIAALAIVAVISVLSAICEDWSRGKQARAGRRGEQQ